MPRLDYGNGLTMELSHDEYLRLEDAKRNPRPEEQRRRLQLSEKTVDSLIRIGFIPKSLVEAQPKNPWLFDASYYYSRMAIRRN